MSEHSTVLGFISNSSNQCRGCSTATGQDGSVGATSCLPGFPKEGVNHSERKAQSTGCQQIRAHSWMPPLCNPIAACPVFLMGAVVIVSSTQTHLAPVSPNNPSEWFWLCSQSLGFQHIRLISNFPSSWNQKYFVWVSKTPWLNSQSKANTVDH